VILSATSAPGHSGTFLPDASKPDKPDAIPSNGRQMAHKPAGCRDVSAYSVLVALFDDLARFSQSRLSPFARQDRFAHMKFNAVSASRARLEMRSAARPVTARARTASPDIVFEKRPGSKVGWSSEHLPQHGQQPLVGAGATPFPCGFKKQTARPPGDVVGIVIAQQVLPTGRSLNNTAIRLSSSSRTAVHRSVRSYRVEIMRPKSPPPGGPSHRFERCRVLRDCPRPAVK